MNIQSTPNQAPAAMRICHLMPQVAPSRDELAGKKRKVARVLSDVNAFLAMCGRLGVDGRDLFSTSDIVEGRNTPQVPCGVPAICSARCSCKWRCRCFGHATRSRPRSERILTSWFWREAEGSSGLCDVLTGVPRAVEPVAVLPAAQHPGELLQTFASGAARGACTAVNQLSQ